MATTPVFLPWKFHGQRKATSLSLFTFMHWRRKWQPTPVFLPGESQGQGSVVGCHLWGRTESDTTEATQCTASNMKRCQLGQSPQLFGDDIGCEIEKSRSHYLDDFQCLFQL